MVERVVDAITAHGYLGIALLMFAENLFPPLPSELIMPFAGFAAARGDLQLVWVVVSGALGSVLGALPWYLAGRWLGAGRLARLADRHGRWLTVSRSELERAEKWFARRGPIVLVVGRLVPALRTLISIPAGITAMPLASFASWSLLGSLLWCSLLGGAGYALESQYEKVAAWLGPFAQGVIAVLVIAYVVRVVRYRKGAGEHEPPSA